MERRHHLTARPQQRLDVLHRHLPHAIKLTQHSLGGAFHAQVAHAEAVGCDQPRVQRLVLRDVGLHTPQETAVVVQLTVSVVVQVDAPRRRANRRASDDCGKAEGAHAAVDVAGRRVGWCVRQWHRRNHADGPVNGAIKHKGGCGRCHGHIRVLRRPGRGHG